jgi:hypothetical protein
MRVPFASENVTRRIACSPHRFLTARQYALQQQLQSISAAANPRFAAGPRRLPGLRCAAAHVAISMNVVFVSPHFPPTWHLFCARLRELGANVLGLADAPSDQLSREVRDALTEYYRVDDLEDYEQSLRALGWFTHRYGRLDRVVSHNEHWLELEAWLRQSFNIPGRQPAPTQVVRRKSLMKKRFLDAGIAAAPGRIARSPSAAKPLIRRAGYPVIAKPDKCVGANATYRLESDEDFERFFANKPPVDYFIEAFVEGEIVTFDGLADREGNVVFHMSLQYSRNIMDVVAEDDHVYYCTLRDIPEDVVQAGTAALRAFDLREQFFHFEFFRTPEGSLLALEVNARPPGWPTVDLCNYANNADGYREWANVVMGRPRQYEWSRQYHAIYIGRKDRMRYAHGEDEISARYGHCILTSMRMPEAFSRAMGDRAWLARSRDVDELLEMAAFVQKTI